MAISQKIRELRTNRRWTQQELATKVSVSPQVVSNWERGYTPPSVEDVSRLAELFDVSIDFLADNEPQEYDPEWQALFEKAKAKGVELEATTLMRNATRLNKDKLQDLLKIFSLIEAEENDNKG